jgi:murein DD-endopeptidase MepM/ murein hydrolase activator NlpD
VVHANGAVDGFGVASHGSIALSNTMPLGGFASGLAIDSTTGGYYESVDDTPLDGYYNPLRGLTSLWPQEVDQGVDYCAAGPIYAIGDGVVANVYSSGWPSGVFISYQLTSGPAKGLYVYDAEDVTPTVSVGEHVTPTTIVGQLHDAATCLETGWADPPGPIQHAAAHLEFNGKNSTAYGLNFNTLLVALGSRPGLPQPDGPPGPLPAHWPTW